MAPVAINVAVSPVQIAALDGVMLITGNEFTVTVNVVVSAQPVALYPMIVYVCVDGGDAVVVSPVTLVKPVFGDQLYVLAPDAVSVVLVVPEQTEDDVPVTVTTGFGETFIRTESFVVQPPTPVPVTT